MSPANGKFGRCRPERKALAVQLLRELAACVAGQAELVEQSPLCSPEWITAQLISLQGLCGFWQRKTGEYVTTWEQEDDALQRAASPDW